MSPPLSSAAICPVNTACPLFTDAAQKPGMAGKGGLPPSDRCTPAGVRHHREAGVQYLRDTQAAGNTAGATLLT